MLIPTGVIIGVGQLEVGACSFMIRRQRKYTLFISVFSLSSFTDNIQIFLGLQLSGAERASVKYKQASHLNDMSHNFSRTSNHTGVIRDEAR